MKNAIKTLIVVFTLVRLLPALLMMAIKKECRDIVKIDLARWIKMEHLEKHNFIWDISYILCHKIEARNIFYCRLRMYYPILSHLIMWLCPPLSSFYISKDNLGGGFWPAHAFSTVVNAELIEENVSVYQQVTIGNTVGRPTLRKGCTICAGAIVLGPIEIGEGSTVGAGAVVTKNVPPHCIVVGNPARIIRRDGIKVNEEL